MVLITGCGEEDIAESDEEIDEPEDSCIPKVPPNEVTVNGISATGSGRMWVVSSTLEPGTQGFTVEWTESDGCMWSQAVGSYPVVADAD